MGVYFCKVIDSKGNSQEITREAPSEDKLIRELSQIGLSPVTVQEITYTGPLKPGSKKYSKNTLLELISTLQILLKSGLTLRDALEVCRTIFVKGDISRIVFSLLEELKKGKSAYQALLTYAGSFPSLFTGMIKIGERVGSLDKALNRLSEYMSEDKKIKEKIIGALIYPAIVLSMAFIGILTIVFYVLPTFKKNFAQMGSKLSESFLATADILNVVLLSLVIIISSLVAAVLFVLLLRKKNREFGVRFDAFLLKLPFVGKARSLREFMNFVFSMETLLQSGLTVEEALEETAQVIQNLAIRRGIHNVREKIIKGTSLARAMVEEPVFPDRLSQWMALGEKTGQLDTIFSQLKSYYQAEIEKWSNWVLNQIQPILILFVGVIILIMMLTFIVPMFSAYSNL